MSRVVSAATVCYALAGCLVLSFSANDPAIKANLLSWNSVGTPLSTEDALARDLSNAATANRSFSHFSPWRFRMKTVLEKTSFRLIVKADLGPIPPPQSPRLTSRPMALNPTVSSSRPLRC
jgi:hypothetical protein